MNLRKRSSKKKKLKKENLGIYQHVAVLVLGDIGRSPRMQYHAISLANLSGVKVSFIGYEGEKCVEELETHSKIQKVTFRPFVSSLPRIPTLFVAWMFIQLRGGCQLVIDWHNFAYTILGLSRGKSHVFVRFSYYYEKFFGQLANGHLCVTEAMQQWLKTNWNINAIVLHDKPPRFFQTTSLRQRHELFSRLQIGINKDQQSLVPIHDKHMETLITKEVNGTIQLRPDRPAVLISSTSWTEDEDFGILLDALEILEKRWLEAADYPTLLGSADLGVCLHTSSSGLDLPMKVLDMFGSGLPVVAVGYPCLKELVEHKKNGLTFQDSKELSEHLFSLLVNFPENQLANKLRQGVEGIMRWPENWKKSAFPLFDQLFSES